jgi:hypothetical protein
MCSRKVVKPVIQLGHLTQAGRRVTRRHWG